MNILLSCAVLVIIASSAFAKESPPKIQVYSHNPGVFDKENTLICHVSDFHPPDIEIQLLKNGVEIQGAEQTDLAFEKGWKFHLTRSVKFSPSSGENYSCKVRHLRNTKTITWDSSSLLLPCTFEQLDFRQLNLLFISLTTGLGDTAL
ncbi:beta-2-microglobulin, like [Tachysurus ichikawai]